MSRAEGPGPLVGHRVIDCSTTFMGPYCTTLLAQWGADVIKVESPGGDVLRGVGDENAIGLGPVFLNANLSKRGIQLDLKSEAGRDVLDRLLGTADVLVHNVRDAGATRVRLDADAVLSRHPHLVHCTFRGYGRGGTDSDKPAYDDVIQAASGLAAVQGGVAGSPAYVRSAIADKTVGIMGAATILAALVQRRTTGRGTAVEVPMFETMASFMLLEQQGAWVFDPPDGPTGYARTSSPHRRPHRTLDGYLSVMAYTDAQWRSFFRIIDRPELAERPEYSSIRQRTLNSDELYALIDEHLSTRTTAEWEDLLRREDLPHGRVRTIEDLFSDPHLRAVGFFESIDDPVAGRLRLARTPVDHDTRPPIRRAPLLGEHGREIAAELGFDDESIAELEKTGAMGRSGAPTARERA